MKIKEANKKDKKGFTMIEILIVVAIIAVLAITIIPMVSNYIQKGKDEYNEKLKNQLLVSGKEYYTNNKVKLPVKNYLGAYKNNKDYSYVTLPEMQSENYVSKDFVDADKRECSKSYVYVRQNDDGKDYEWHACLICSGEDGKTINYSKGDPACEIVDWGDTKQPTCSKDANFVGGRKNNNKVFNPEKVYLKDLADKYNGTKEGKLAGIEIKNKTTNEVFYVEANSNSIGDNQNIDQDLMSKITATFKEKQKKEGEYEISVYDTAGHKSKNSCASFIIDETAPTCTLDEYQDKDKKTLTLNTLNEEKIYNDEYFKTIVSMTNYSGNVKYIDQNGNEVKPGEPYIYDLKANNGKDGMYYGNVMDEAGNIGTCEKNVKIKMFPREDPKCSVLDTADAKWYSPSGTNKSKTLHAECYVAGGVNATIDPDKIALARNSGTIIKAEDRDGNTNIENKVRFKITYKPNDNQYYKDEQVVINKGFVTDSIGTTNTSTSSNYIKVDSILPKIIFNPQTAKESGGWYKAPFRLNISCSDSQSGVREKTFKVNGKLSSKNPTTITWNSAANPKTWTAECKDVAGNSNKDSQPYKIKENNPAKVCGVKQYKSCRTSACGVSYYKTCRTSACGCQTRNRCKACGCATYTSWKLSSSRKKCSKCVGSGLGIRPSTGCKSSSSTYKKTTCTSYTQIKCTTGVAGGQYTFKACKTQKTYTRSCATYKRCSSCSCATYYSCANKACGVVYNSCRTSACGVKSYKSCWHY